MAKVVNSDVKPTFISKPDMRFATTFLSTKYREYAVNGEGIMDKQTGELFIKRPEDGRVVSFYQNKKYMHDLMLELRVLLTNNEGFVYPKTNESAYYLATDYDLVAINNEKLNDIMVNDTKIANSGRDLNKLQFRISPNSNGFFCRPMSRDTDKVIIEYLTNEYNTHMENYNGDNISYLAEAEKFKKYEKWKDSNAVLYFTVTVRYGNRERSYACMEHIRVNEEMLVYIPYTKILEEFQNGVEEVLVKIDSIDYPKIHYMIEHQEKFEGISEEIEKFMYLDKHIYINYLSIMSFVDSSKDVELLGNEFLIAAIDMPYVRRYMAKLAKLKNTSEMILSIQRPDVDDWSINTIWAERVRDVYENGNVIWRDSEVDFKRMEAFLAKKPGIIQTEITENNYEYEKLYLENPEKKEYVADEINHKFEELERYLEGKLEEAITMVDDDVQFSGASNKMYMNVERKGGNVSDGSSTLRTDES